MAAVVVTIAAGRATPGHKQAVITCGTRRVRLPCTSPKVDHQGFAGDWKQVARAGDKPLLGMAGGQLHTAKVDVIIADVAGKSVEPMIYDLVQISQDRINTVALTNYGFFEAGPWRLTDFTITSDLRELGTNRIIRANATLTLTEATAPPRPQAPVKKPASSKKTPGKATVAKARIYTVVRGDTLSRIAVRFYHDANDWQKIAKANHLRDPNRIYPGQKLKIP